MPQTRECDYCGGDIPPGTGTMLVRTSGQTVHYCSSKCEKNADLGREPRDVEWTESGGSRERRAADAEAEAEAAEEAEDEQDAQEAETEEESEAEEDADEDAEAEADDESEDDEE
ncbi:50S ribosomal protein L24e [Natronoarchaeum mannanilyticum]|uniref:Large ribosomal subunit protein eL24 n=1 Tax=Natronoarchaeum mannanilyticum TaxID=926360 RepID=A0AAV3TD29_9EURY